MRAKIFRAIAALLFVLIVVVATRVWVRQLSFPPDRDDLMALVGVLVFAPTFAIYALLGERAAYRVLTPGMALWKLPEVVLGKVLQKYVSLPESEDDPPFSPEPKAPQPQDPNQDSPTSA